MKRKRGPCVCCLQVLCGAENGSLLMWSGSLIKFVVRQSHDVPCHRGAITVVLAEHNRKRILTAGIDGSAFFTCACASVFVHPSCHCVCWQVPSEGQVCVV